MTASAVSANRDVLLALAGVFFVLPSFAFALLYPQPEPPAGAAPSTSRSYTQASRGAVTPDRVTRIASAAAPTAVSRRGFHLDAGEGMFTGPAV